MKEVAFVMKVFAITLVVVVFMQIRVGTMTLEERASLFIQDSWVTGQIQEVGDGLQKVLAQVTGTLGKKFSGVFKKEEVQERGDIKLQRSQSFQKEQEAKTASAH
jgi:hypothetical protein